ncbi:MAG TPA: hypothetical protein DGT23_26195 [Micromonosporaceae bacterium]|nr:hypothetical protein [Micromonosporaceae bacterium]
MTSAKLANIALKQVSEVLDKLTDEQLTELAEGRASFEFRSIEVVIKAKPAKPVPPSADWTLALEEIRGLETATEVIDYLERKKFKQAELKQIAKAIGPTVSQTGTKNDDIRRNIAEGTAGFRERAAAMGSWQRR